MGIRLMTIKLRRYSEIGELHIENGVKNGFSSLTKEQKGRDWPRKDIVNRHQVRALREGWHERRKARAGVSSREEKHTNRNLARVTTKSKSRMQTVSNGRVS